MGTPREEVLIDYTNYHGERSKRLVRPLSVAFENSEWHPDTQWILHAIDVERGETREFALKDIHSWEPVS
jgi:predicted DNA-binding transcriptional regulator YafY